MIVESSRRFGIEPELLPLLRAMHAESGGIGSLFGPLPSEKHFAPMLRRDLQRAGVTRAELFITDRTRRKIRFHDLRATGITWMAVRGDKPLEIQHRAGHREFSTTQGYIREAVTILTSFGTPFPTLPAAIVSSEESSERLGKNGHVYKIRKKVRVGEAGIRAASQSRRRFMRDPSGSERLPRARVTSRDAR